MRATYFRATLRAALCLPLCCSVVIAFAQDATREVLVGNWERSSTEQKGSAISAGLSSPARESKALALSGVARLEAEDRASAQQRFPASSIRPYLRDTDAEVARQAARAYVAVSVSDETAEADIVAIAASGQSPLRPHEYIRYLRPHGITSEAGRQWLTSLAQGPLSVEKYSAVEALVTLNGTPPASLLPQVMELIRSPEYFCAPNLVLSLEKFGRHATRYIDELVELRAKLEIEAKLPVDYRTVVLRTDFAAAASEMDRAIAALQE